MMHKVDAADSASVALAARRAMSARIAHDINNLLTPLIAYPQLIRMYAEGNEQILKLLGAMETSAQDMLHLTERLGQFSKGQESTGQTSPVACIHAAVSDVCSEASREVTSDIAEGIGDEQLALGADAAQKVVSAVLTNALEATREDGKVELSLKLERVDGPLSCAGSMLRAGHYAALTIRDTGEGLRADNVEEVFEPLYTTRKTEKGRGAGMGLPIAAAILADIGGGVCMRAEGGEGTTVTIYLPLVGTRADQAAATDPIDVVEGELAHSESRQGGTRYDGRVLIIDDEQPIVDVFRIMLCEELPGIVVDSAGNGSDGVRQFQECPPDVVILDLHMPVMDGLTAFKRMLEVSDQSGRPMPKVLFCTGYAPPDGVRDIIKHGGTAHEVLFKPVSTQDLVERVAREVATA